MAKSINIDEMINSLNNAIDAIKKESPDITKRLALTAKDKIEERVKDIGVGEYSTNPVPTFFFYGKSRNQGGRDIIDKKEDDNEGLTWGEFRKAQGLQNDHVDLTYSGRMFANIKLTNLRNNQYYFIATIAPDIENEIKKLGYQTDRYGDFLILTPDQDREVTELAQLEFDHILNRFFK